LSGFTWATWWCSRHSGCGGPTRRTRSDSRTSPMVTAFALSPARIGSVINRNVGALRSGPSYWAVLISGFFEPLLYLFSIGVGVGALVGNLDVSGQRMSYAAFVAPAMLAVSAMSGALA